MQVRGARFIKGKYEKIVCSLVVVNGSKLKLLIILLMMPSLAFASGDFILPTLFIQIGSFIAFVIFAIFIQMKLIGKFLLTWVYFITLFLVWYLFSGKPFLENIIIINFCIAFIPVVTVCFAWFMLKSRFKKI